MDVKATLSPTLQLRNISNFKLNQPLEIKIIASKPLFLDTKLQPSNQNLKLESNLPFNTKPGQTFTLVVSKITPNIEFKLLETASNSQLNTLGLVFKAVNPNQPKQSTPPPQEQHLSQAEQKVLSTIKQTLPIQQPSTELLNQLLRILPQLNQNRNNSKTLKRLAKQILQHAQPLQKTEAARQINQSGLFLEANLAVNKQPNYQSDYKALLLKFKRELARQINKETHTTELNLLKQTQQKTEGSLAKLILNQLSSLPKEDGGKQVWVLDLPFFNQQKAESARLEIDYQQQSDQAEDPQNWSVNLTVSPPNLGTIQCKISCQNQIINTVFLAENKVVVNLIDQNLGLLQNKLEQSGLKTGHISANQAIVENKDSPALQKNQLLDQQV